MSRLLVVEADGGSRGNPGRAAFGALVRDGATGELLAERAERIGIASNNVAEYSGLVAGLEAAAEIDPDATVQVRMDSKLVVEQMSGRWQIKHPDMRVLARKARASYNPSQVSYQWIPRAENKHADRLVNDVLDGKFVADGFGVVPREPADHQQAVVEGGEIQPPPEVLRTPNRIIGWSTDLGTPTTFLLLRHGETPHTAAKVFSGSGGADPGLSARGEDEARAAAAALVVRGGVDAVIASPLRRTQETAGFAAAALGLEVSIDKGFAEASFGAWDGLSLADVATRWPDELEAWLASSSVAPPGGESMDAVAVRVSAARARVMARHHGQTVLVATHVNPIKTLVRLALNAPPEAVYRMELAPASLSEIQYYDNGIAALRAFSVTSHVGSPGLEGL